MTNPPNAIAIADRAGPSNVGLAIHERMFRLFTLSSILSLVLLVALLGLWEGAVRWGHVQAFVLPAPSDIAHRIIIDVQDPGVRYDFLYTLAEIVVGFLIAAVAGILLGIVIALVPLVDKILTPYIVAFQTIPKVAVAPLLIIWFGFGISSKIIIVTLICFFPILVNSVVGFRMVDQRQLLLMKALKASWLQVFLKIRLPNAMPSLMAGVYIATIFSVIGAVVGEFLGSSHGLGSQILQRQASMDVIGVFSMVGLLTMLGLLLNIVTKWLSRRLVFWSGSDERQGV